MLAISLRVKASKHRRKRPASEIYVTEDDGLVNIFVDDL